MRLAAPLMTVLLLTPALAGAQSVAFLSPPADQPSYGSVEIEVRIDPSVAARSVTFFADGRQVGVVTVPPYKVTASVGEENVEHTYRVVVTTAGGPIEGTLRTPRLQIDQSVTFELQQLYVTASDRGQRVLDLREDEFEVFDDGDRQDLHAFARGDVPLTPVVLLDASVSKHGQMLTAA